MHPQDPLASRIVMDSLLELVNSKLRLLVSFIETLPSSIEVAFHFSGEIPAITATAIPRNRIETDFFIEKLFDSNVAGTNDRLC